MNHPRQKHFLRIVHISDTHMIPQTCIPFGDVLIHSGDFLCHRRSPELVKPENYEQALQVINEFFGHQPHPYKIYVAGNQEVCISGHSDAETQHKLPNLHYLQDSGVVICGVRFYGSPWVQKTHRYNQGFVKDEDDIARTWQQIPTGTDVLITHMPPAYVVNTPMNSTTKVKHWGCKHLLRNVMRVRPRFHLFGHLHEYNGSQQIEGTVFSNAAVERGGPVRCYDYILPNTMTPSS